MRFVILIAAIMIAYAISPENINHLIAISKGIFIVIMMAALLMDTSEFAVKCGK